MSTTKAVRSDHQLARLLQVGIVLEEVVEARAAKHARSSSDVDEDVIELLEEASHESAEHRERLEALIEDLDAETVPYEEIEALVEARYDTDDDFDSVLYDQLCNEETAFKFYDDLVRAIETSDVRFSIDRERLLDVLTGIREEESEGVEEVTEIMEGQG